MDGKAPGISKKKGYMFTLFFAVFCFTMGDVYAAELTIVSHQPLASVTALQHKTAQLSGLEFDFHQVTDNIDWTQYQVVILVGEKALQRWQKTDVATVAVLVSQQAVETFHEKLTSAIYIEPPLQRQIGLAKALLGEDKPLGVLLASENDWQLTDYRGESIQQAQVTPYFVDQYPNLNRALADLLRTNDALIGQYDPSLYRSDNIKNILITAYRQNKPLIGPSAAYIKAGALITTYSNLNDVALRLAEILQSGLEHNTWPAAGFNPYFKVRFNKQVARSLNLPLPDAKQLQQELMQQEGG